MASISITHTHTHTHTADLTDEDTPAPPELPTTLKPLSTPCNLWIIWFFSVFNNTGYYLGFGIGILRYLQWGLSIINIVQAGIIIYTLQTLTQVVVAVYSDRTVTKYGRRKPYIIAGNLIRFVSIFLLCVPPSHIHHTSYLFAWYVVFNTLSWMGYTIHLNPYQSLLIESTINDEDFVRIRAIALPVGGLVGGISAAVLLLISPLAAALYYVIGGSMALTCFITYIPSVCYREQKALPHIIPSIRMICSQNNTFIQVFWARVFGESACITYAALIYFICATSFHFKKESNVVFIILLCGVIGGILGVTGTVLCNWIFQCLDRLKVLYSIQLTAAVLSFLTFFISLTDSPTLFVCYVVICIIMAMLAVVFQIITEILMRDLVVYDTFVTGFNRENMYIAAMVIPVSILSQFISAIPVVVVTLTGFHANDENISDDEVESKYSWGYGSTWAFRCFASFFIMCLALSSYMALRNFPLTKKVTNTLNAVVKQREATKHSIYEPIVNQQEQRDEEQELVSSAKTANTVATELEGTSSSPMEEPTSSMKLQDDQRQLLLHLSLPELYRVFSTLTYPPVQDGNSASGLRTIMLYVKISLVISASVLVLYVVALAMDGSYLNGTFSTLLIYVLLLDFFYFMYELFRYVAMMNLISWTLLSLRHLAKLTYIECSVVFEDIHQLLAREEHIERDINIHVPLPEDEPTEQQPIESNEIPPQVPADGLLTTQDDIVLSDDVDSNKFVFEIEQKLEDVNKHSPFVEDHVEENAYQFMLGYHYVFGVLFVLIGFGVFVIAYAAERRK